MLKLKDLAARADLRMGSLSVSPSRRLVEGPGGQVHVEPLTMQVLLLLLDAAGKVVTRDELFDQCWGGVMVGDASLNRVIAKVRQIAEQVAPGQVEIETIPRTGYRLTGEFLEAPAKALGEAQVDATETPAISRRRLVGGGVAFAAALGAGAIWWTERSRSDARFNALMDGGSAALLYGFRTTGRRASTLFYEAVQLRPREARAWGLLAYAQLAETGSGPRDGGTVQSAEEAARKALQLDSKNPDALLTLLLIGQSMKDRATVEDGLRQILAASPDNAHAMLWLERLLAGAGRIRESWVWTERIATIEPISPALLLNRSFKLWEFGRLTEALQASIFAMDLWPAHPLVRMARLMICAFTERTREALAIVEEEKARPILLTAEGVSMWQASLAALETRSISAIDAARAANLAGARSSSALAAYALVIMSALGDLDNAFAIADGFLLSRGPVVLQRKPGPRSWLDGPGWRNTLGLFIPPTKAMRLDPRFSLLCDGLGLTEYWRKRGGPDAFLMRP